MGDRSIVTLPLLEPGAGLRVPTAPFLRLSALWIQITGTWCNLECTHCLNGSGPREPWLRPLDGQTVREALRQGEALGVKEIYFTGGEPFLHPEILTLVGEALGVAPTTVLTNGIRISEAVADALADLAARTPYSLEIRVSLDDVDPEANDRVRGPAAWQKAVAAVRRLAKRGLLPIVTATEISMAGGEGAAIYQRFRDLLLSEGIERPRVKIIPVLPAGRLAGTARDRLSEESSRASTGGSCSARIRVSLRREVSTRAPSWPASRARSSRPEVSGSRFGRLSYHPACVTCHVSGMSCRNS